jgi:hypothetical protein
MYEMEGRTVRNEATDGASRKWGKPSQQWPVGGLVVAPSGSHYGPRQALVASQCLQDELQGVTRAEMVLRKKEWSPTPRQHSAHDWRSR